MPSPAATPRSRTTKRTPATNGHARRRRPARRRSRPAEIGELEAMIRGLEQRIAQLTSGPNIRSTIAGAGDQLGSAVGGAVTDASHYVGDMAADVLTDVAGRFRTGANSVTHVARSGTGALRKIGNELERRPYMTVAIALGIGFLAGLSGRREDAR